MKTTRKLIIGALGTVLFSATASFAVVPGQGWDAFNAGAINEGVGEVINAMPGGYKGTSLGSKPGQGWDSFAVGQGERIPEASTGYRGTSMQTPSGGYDAFGSGSKDL